MVVATSQRSSTSSTERRVAAITATNGPSRFRSFFPLRKCIDATPRSISMPSLKVRVVSVPLPSSMLTVPFLPTAMTASAILADTSASPLLEIIATRSS